MNMSPPKMSPPPKAQKPPTRDEAKLEADEKERMRRRKGKASTVLTGNKSRTQIASREQAKTKMGM